MNSYLIDKDAVLWSAPPSELVNRPLLLLLHGYNSDESDLFALIPQLPQFPVIASLRAPLQFELGYGWYPIHTENSKPNTTGEDEVTTEILNWLITEAPLATRIGVVGFSQGATIAVELLRRNDSRIKFAANLSGWTLPPWRRTNQLSRAQGEHRDEVLSVTRPPLFWGRGTKDEIIATAAVDYTEGWVDRHTTATVRVYEDLNHAISITELAELSEFINQQFTN